MHFFKFSAIFCIIFFAKPAQSKKVPLEHLISVQKLVKSICKITNDGIYKKTEIQDILIGNLASELWNFDINDVVRCIGDRHPVVVTDFVIDMSTKYLRRASLVILSLNKTDTISIVTLIKNHRRSTVWHHMAKVICVVSPGLSLKQRQIILQSFLLNGIWNVVLVYESVKGIEYETIKPFANHYKRLMITNPKDSTLIFPDKLKNLQGFEYQIVSVNNINDSYITPFMIHFLHVIQNQQNSTFKVLNLQNITVMEDYWRRRKMHLLINISTIKNSPEPKLMTYEERSYCALIPISEKASFVHIFITKPFDRCTWMLIALSVVCTVAVWRMFHGRGAVDSHWKVAAVMFMIFTGQSLEFSRRNRTVLLILLHLISISMFILSNTYESVVTSIMIDPGRKYLKSVKDLMESHFEIIAGEAFHYNFHNDSDSSRISLSNSPMRLNHETNLIQQRYAFIRLCNIAEHLLNLQLNNKRFLSDYYYILQERIPNQFIYLEASYLNPFLERFQYHMDLSFEAGLPKMWKTFESRVISKPEESADFLKLKDLGPIFSILFVGYTLSVIVLLIEIFYKDFIRHLDWSGLYQRLRTCINSCFSKMTRKRRPKVKKIFVQPRRSDV